MKFPAFDRTYKGSTAYATAAAVTTPNELADFLNTYGGRSYENGLYRTHSFESALKWTVLLEEYYPEFKGKIRCFAYDWEGNMFVQRTDGNGSFIMIFEISSGDYFELEQTIAGFHEEDLIDYREDTLHEQKFRDVITHLNISGLSPDECIAHKISLLLNGEDTSDNMEASDMEVTWSMQQQIMDEINKIP